MKTAKHLWRASISAVALITGAAVSNAYAGAFGIREQSAEFQGESFAGDAAGGALSSMFWNPAAAAAKEGINTESTYNLFVPDTSIEATGGLWATGLPYSHNGGSFGGDAVVPASYANYQLNDRWFLGFALNSPDGFAVKPQNFWDGSLISETAKVFTIDANPNIAYRLTDNITIGAGIQLEYFHVKSTSGNVPANALGLGSPALPGHSFDLADWALGATAGVIYKPTATTTIGVGYKSEVDLPTTGTCTGVGATGAPFALVNGSCSSPQSVHHDFTNPGTLTVSLRQDLTDRLTALATYEFTNWSVQQPGFIYNAGNLPVQALPVAFKDGQFYASGAEYKYSPSLTLRTGLSYEKSPVSDAVRTLFLPDADRWTPSIGASYKWSDRITVDVAYSHVFFMDAPITTNAPVLTADAKTSLDVLSVGLKYKVAGPVSLESLK